MAYTKTVWVNNQAPAINADNLNKIEDGIYNSVRYADAQNLTATQKAQAMENIGAATVDHNHHGKIIEPTSVELYPGTSAGHGGYIDFHFNSDSADYTSRIIEPSKGVLQYNNHGILTTTNVVAFLNVNITFTNGVATFKNSAINSHSVTFVQWRAGAVSTLVDSVLSTTPQNGSMLIIAKAGTTGGPIPVNILIINQ